MIIKKEEALELIKRFKVGYVPEFKSEKSVPGIALYGLWHNKKMTDIKLSEFISKINFEVVNG
jgi:hypothetical protein